MVVHFPASYVRLPRRVPKDLKKSPEIRRGKAQRTTPVVELQELGEPEIQKARMMCENRDDVMMGVGCQVLGS